MVLIVAGLGAGVAGAWVARIALGVPGALGLIALAVWARRVRLER
ncbi:MAG: hypothetical protein U0R71_17855 [Solirubrobacterales bacterium]